MIEGIQVLSQEPIMESGRAGFVFAVVCVIIGAIVGFIVEVIKNNGVGSFIFGVSVCFGLAVGFAIDSSLEVHTGQTEYKVIIDDSVSMTEFHKHYELIGQDGEIFIIRDKVPASE